jgi:mRNA interferase MazF
VALVVKRFDVFRVKLDPNVGSEIQKTRPCLVISPDEMNKRIATVIIAPMTTKGRPYPSRIVCHFQGKDGQIVLDQIRTVDKNRLHEYLGQISADEQKAVLDTLVEMFAE